MPFLFLGLNVLWETLFAGTVLALYRCWNKIGSSAAKTNDARKQRAGNVIAPNVVALGLYAFSVVALAIIHQLLSGWIWLGGFIPLICIFLLSPLLMFAVLATLHSGFRARLFATTSMT